jgi:hypothetical protein
MDASTSTQGLTEALQQGLGFTTDDLHSNENGQLSDRQKAALVARLDTHGRELGQGCRFTLVLIPLIVLIALVAVFFLVAGDTASALLNAAKGLASQPYAPIFAVPVVILILVALNNIRLQERWRSNIRRIREAPDSAEILSREGVVRRYTVHGGRGMVSHYVVFGGKPLQVFGQQQYNAFHDGVAYQVYFVQLGPLPFLLSAKVVGN